MLLMVGATFGNAIPSGHGRERKLKLAATTGLFMIKQNNHESI